MQPSTPSNFRNALFRQSPDSFARWKHRIRRLAVTVGVGSSVAFGLPAQATTIGFLTLTTIPYDSGLFTYTALDANGTSLTVQQTPGASMGPIGGEWPGLHLGSQQDSGTYSFTFSQPVSSVRFYITAQSTAPNGSYSEVFRNFTSNAASTLSVQSEYGTVWDGMNLTSTVADGGRTYVTFTSVAAAGFTSAWFDHVQLGRPNGSVIQQIDYALAVAVPEPASIALLLAGLGIVGVAGRRGRRE